MRRRTALASLILVTGILSCFILGRTFVLDLVTIRGHSMVFLNIKTVLYICKCDGGGSLPRLCHDTLVKQLCFFASFRYNTLSVKRLVAKS